MTGQNILDLFDTLTDGLSELSADGKLALANRKYKEVANERDWEWLRTTATKTIASGEIALESNFKKFVPNEYGQEAPYKWVFYIGQSVYPILRLAERKRFDSYAYYDQANSKIVLPDNFNKNGESAEYDYFRSVDDLTTATSPLIDNEDYHAVIAYLMAVEHYDIDQTEAGRSKRAEYQNTADNIMENMEYDDNQLKEAGLNYA